MVAHGRAVTRSPMRQSQCKPCGRVRPETAVAARKTSSRSGVWSADWHRLSVPAFNPCPTTSAGQRRSAKQHNTRSSATVRHPRWSGIFAKRSRNQTPALKRSFPCFAAVVLVIVDFMEGFGNMKTATLVKLECLNCRKCFDRKSWRALSAKKFCCKECRNDWMHTNAIGNTSGRFTPGSTIGEKTRIKRGQRIGIHTEFKAGQPRKILAIGSVSIRTRTPT